MPDSIPVRRKLTFALIVLVIFFGGLETILRAYDFPFYFNFSADLLGMPLLDLSKFRRVANNTVEFDQAVFWKFKPDQILDTKGIYRKPVRINHFGFRGPDFQLEKKPDTFRIICLGDSVTFGWSVGDSETYPAQLQSLLRIKYPGRTIEVINLGVTGYTSFQGKELFLAFAQKLKPDLIIFGFGPNDRLPALSSDQELYDSRAWQKNKLDLLLSHSQVYKLLKAGVIYLQRRTQGLSLNPRTFFHKLKRKVSLEEYQHNFETIKQECDRLGCKMILLNLDFPSLPLDPVTQSLEQMGKKYDAGLPANWREWNSLELNQKIAGPSRIPLLDLKSIFADHLGRGKTDVWKSLMVDNGHPNQSGHRLIAENLAQRIEELVNPDQPTDSDKGSLNYEK